MPRGLNGERRAELLLLLPLGLCARRCQSALLSWVCHSLVSQQSQRNLIVPFCKDSQPLQLGGRVSSCSQHAWGSGQKLLLSPKIYPPSVLWPLFAAKRRDGGSGLGLLSFPCCVLCPKFSLASKLKMGKITSCHQLPFSPSTTSLS